MSQTSSKKGFGFFKTMFFIVVCHAVALALAAGIYFLAIHGTFGLDSTHNGNCYDPLITWLLIGGALIAAGLTVLKRYGLASAVTALVPGVALCLFVHKCYWYVVDVFVGIDEKHGFDPRFITFTVLILAAFVIGEAAIYIRKVKKA